MVEQQFEATKVAELSGAFWVVKILSTGLGETASDFLVKRFDPVIVIPAATIALVVALAWQWLVPVYSKWRYWTAVGLVAVVGTMAADVLHVGLGVPYTVSSAVFACILVALFVTWNWVEHTLSIHSIINRRRELFYWAVVMATFALGTAVGDLTASSFGLGYWLSGVLFLGLYCVPMIVGRLATTGEVAWFWAAYVLTRPLGASFADWVGVSSDRGGLGFGTGPVTVLLLAAAIALVAVQPFPATAPEHPTG